MDLLKSKLSAASVGDEVSLMIHISQEELLRKIEEAQEKHHRQQQIQLQQQQQQVKCQKQETLSQASLTRGPRDCCGSHEPLEVQRRRPSREQEHMSTILSPSSISLATDRNNNTSKAASTQPPDEAEIQAVLITGCGSKIGSSIAAAFAKRGLKVALVDFDINQTDAVARECQEKSPKNRVPLQIVADISQLAEAHKVIDRTIEAFGRLDVLVNTVNNASLMEAKFNASGDDDPHVFEQYHKIIANNMHAVTYLCISAAPYLRKTKGSIVNVSSIENNETGSYKFAYCMSKAGISTLTKCLATDLAPDIRVICVAPKAANEKAAAT